MTPDYDAIDVGLRLARGLFEEIGSSSFDGVGFTRDAYGEGEHLAHATVTSAAHTLDLSVEVDAALNLSMVLPGQNPEAPRLVIGSHLDSVPRGGNFDGLAGVLAGLATAAAFRAADISPERDLVIMALRAEESAWFGAQHIGSRALFGTLNEAILHQSSRVDTGRSLAEHMARSGVDLQRLRSGRPLIDPQGIAAYLELHIEQGPQLVRSGVPLGIVTGIRGNRRCRKAICIGEYGHSGTVPRSLRHDAVFAVSELITAMDQYWREAEESDGSDLVITFGRFLTDAASHGITTVPGQVEFSFDIRSHSVSMLERTEARLFSLMEAISAKRGVTFTCDPLTGDPPAAMDTALRDLLADGCKTLGTAALPIASGAGHDAGDFAAAGVPSAMIFLRNDKGSHNPDESMDFVDFAAGTRLMTWFVANFPAGAP